MQFEVAQPQLKEELPCTWRFNAVDALSETVRATSASTVAVSVNLCMRARQEKCQRAVQLCNLIKCAKRIRHEVRSDSLAFVSEIFCNTRSPSTSHAI